MDDDAGWPAPWVRAALGTAVLAVLEVAPRHGYGVAEALDERGLGRPRGGSLYPLLQTLEDAGAVTATWEPGAAGPGRRTYVLTDTGRARLVRERNAWQRLVGALSSPDRPARTPQEETRGR